MKLFLGIFKLIYDFTIKPLAFKIIEKEFNIEKERLEEEYKKNRKLREEINDLKNENSQMKAKYDRIKSFINHYKNYDKDVVLSENDELIFIFFNKENMFYDTIYLCGENGLHHSNDSMAELTLYNYCNTLKINYLQSNTNRKGYARVLISYIINKAFQDNIKEVYGDLAPCNKEQFDWLIPFYKSAGFRCILYDDSPNGMSGKVYIKRDFLDNMS